MTRPVPTPDAVATQLRLFVRPGQVTELRALNVGGPNRTFAGWFHHDRLRDLARHALALSRESSGVYFIPNPVDPSLLARRPNTILNVPPKKSPQRIELTTDRDIVERQYLIIDFDPVRFRPAPESDPDAKVLLRRGPNDSIPEYRTPLTPDQQKSPATTEEIRFAQGIAQYVASDLVREGWAPPIVMMSGNGIHLVFRLSSPLPYFPPELDPLAELLRGLSARESIDGFITVDRNTYTAARMLKVPGTMTRKGEEQPGRPYRRAEIIEVPNGWDAHDAAGSATYDEAHARPSPGTGGDTFQSDGVRRLETAAG